MSGDAQWIWWAVFAGLDGMVFLFLAVCAGLLLRHDRVATLLVGSAAILRAGAIGLSMVMKVTLPDILGSMSDQAMYDLIPWVFTVEGLVFSSGEAMQWVLVSIAVFRGRTLVLPEPEPEPEPVRKEEPPLEPMIAPSELGQPGDDTTVLTRVNDAT